MHISRLFTPGRSPLALAALLTCAVLSGAVSAQPSQRRPAAPPGVDPRAELRRDVTDEQSGRTDDRARAPTQRHLSTEQRAELRRLVREQAQGQPGRADRQR
jgi:hypothetical protein